MNSNFKVALELLNRYSVRPFLFHIFFRVRVTTSILTFVLLFLGLQQTRHFADIHLSPHVQELTALIRNSAVVLYFQPFASIKLERMSAAFGWTVEEVEWHVVNLIQAGEIHGRVDSQNKACGQK